MIVAGTPVHGGKNASNNQYYDSSGMWNAYGYYGDAYSTYAYGGYYDSSSAAATAAVGDTATNAEGTLYYFNYSQNVIY